MTVELEKIFFNYIYLNKQYIQHVNVTFFKNPDIAYIYSSLRKFILDNPSADIPSNQQLYALINVSDKDGKITKAYLKALLSTNLDKFDEEHFIKPELESHIISNKIQDATSEVIDLARTLEVTQDKNEIKKISETIKNKILDSTNTSFLVDDDLGSDFDNPDDHSQDHAVTKIRTGFPMLDDLTGGGLDRGTFISAMAKTNAGKSIFMQNISCSVANQGHNVIYFTLEMSEKKVLKRMGAMRLKIPINNYDKYSIDTDYIKERIDNLNSNRSNLIEEETKKRGKIFVKYFAAGVATPSDLETYIKKLEIAKGIKIDLLVVDYINLMATPKGVDNNLYMKGKFLAEGLRALASKYNAPLLTATQLAKDAWDAQDITLQDIPESKAIAETADLLLGLIVTEELKKDNKVRVKLLKQRDGDFSKMYLTFHINPMYLSYDLETEA